MAKAKAPDNKRSDLYRDQTLRPLHCLAFILPMLLAFQIGTAIYGSSLLAPRDLHKLLRYFGAQAMFLPALFVIMVLLAQHVLRKDPWQLRPKVLAGMLGESVVWMIPLIVMAQLAGRIMAHQAAAPAATSESFWPQLILAFGAGVYEEFIFRLVLICIVMMILVDIVMLKKEPVAVAAILIGAVLFSLYHLSSAEMSLEFFPWGKFIFRWVAGVYLGGIFVFRGYGIAVGAHAFYDIYVAIAHLQNLGS